jgi:CDP-diglyceride synthetase
MMYIFPLFFLGALYSGQSFCIYMGCTDIGYCIYDICGFYGWFWFSFMVMCMDMCMDVFGYVFGYVFGLCVWIPGLDPPRGLVQ